LLQESSILERRYEETGPGDFEFLEILGQGVCGQVCQVRKKSGKDKGKRFAMKVLMKTIINLELEKYNRRTTCAATESIITAFTMYRLQWGQQL
ncbi:hypothetical protein NPIL_291491, partial [Nephila pilipes]